ncbi:MAG: response regulator [Phycisphaera sp.]|nr:response regulator [Phycisphaera sp.]
MKEATPTVYLVDDEPAVLRALDRLLRAEGFGVVPYDSPQEFLEKYDARATGCVVLDLSMPQMTGLDLQRELADQGSVLAIIFLTGRGDIRSSVEAMRAGAVDFLTKPVNDDELIAAVHQAIAQSRGFGREQAEADEIEQRLATLTPREREVLSHLISGRLNKQIAADLGTVEKTIKVHRARVLEKMQAPSLAELVRMAGRVGIEPAESPNGW